MKILISAYPHTGVEQFSSIIIDSTKSYRKNNPTEMPEGGEWVIAKKDSMLLLGNYGYDVTQYTILRNPLEAVALNVDIWFSGVTDQLINGNNVINRDNIKTNKELSESDKNFITHQLEVYRSYMLCAQINKKVKYFKYEDIFQNPVQCVRRVLDISAPRLSGINIMIDPTKLHNDDNNHSEFYEIIKDHILNHPDYEYTQKLYETFASKTEVITE
jgi:hypothetical protein